MNPRVLIVSPRLDVGGTEIHLLRLLPPLRREGIDVSLFPIARGGALEPALLAAGVPVIGPELPPFGPLRSLLVAGALRREIRRIRPDILHFFLPEPYLVGSLAAAGFGGLARIMSRRSLSHYQRNHPLLGRIERWLHRSIDGLIALSSAVAVQLVEECGHPEKVGIIHNGIVLPPLPDAQTRAAFRHALEIADDAFVIAVVANLFPYKGHADLLVALAGIRERLHRPWRLMVIGRDEGIGATLREQAEALNIDQNVLWLGERLDASTLLAAADMGVLPSHQEGFAMSLIEKMAQGLPVVATRAGGPNDIIVDGESGRLVPVADPAALGAAIFDLYEDAGLRARLGVGARLRVERMFTLETCLRRYRNLYLGIIGNRLPLAELIDPACSDSAASVNVVGSVMAGKGVI
jgi:glycosyltransferase involved in cell wall biosynthesis